MKLTFWLSASSRRVFPCLIVFLMSGELSEQVAVVMPLFMIDSRNSLIQGQNNFADLFQRALPFLKYKYASLYFFLFKISASARARVSVHTYIK